MSKSIRIFLVGIAPIVLLGLGAEVHAQDEVDCFHCVDTRDIAAEAVTTGKIKQRAVTTGKIAPKAITSGKIKNGAVTVKKVSPKLSNSIGTFCAPGDYVTGQDANGNFICQSLTGDQGPPAAPVIGVADLNGFAGDSRIIGYEDLFEIRELAFSIVQPRDPIGGGGGGPQGASLQDIRLTINDQQAIPILNLAAAIGDFLPMVDIFLFSDITSPDTSTIDLQLTLMNVLITSIDYRPPSIDGDPLLVDLTLLPASIAVTNAAFETTMFDRANPSDKPLCMFPNDALLFVHDVNANPASVGTAIDSYGFGLGNAGDPVGGGGGGVMPSFDEVTITAGLINEAACLFGHVASGSQFSNLEIESYQSPLLSSPSSKLTLDGVYVTSLGLVTGPKGGVRVTSSFLYEVIRWEATEFDQNGNPQGTSEAGYNVVTGTGF